MLVKRLLGSSVLVKGYRIGRVSQRGGKFGVRQLEQRTGYFSGQLGRKIFWQTWGCENPRAILLVSHGLGEHGERYRPLAEALVNIGYLVAAIDHRGHGHSYGHRGAIEQYQYAVDDLSTLKNRLLQDYPGLPLLLFGHSMGGAIAVGSVLASQADYAGLILSGAALDAEVVPQAVQRLGGMISSVFPTLPTFKMAPKLVSQYPETVKDFKEDPLNLAGKVPLKTISEVVLACGALKKRFADIELPVLILHGGGDKLVPASSSEYLYSAVSSEDKALEIFPGLYHEILNESPEQRDKVISVILEWLGARV